LIALGIFARMRSMASPNFFIEFKSNPRVLTLIDRAAKSNDHRLNVGEPQ
jgi:hypothetical protein